MLLHFGLKLCVYKIYHIYACHNHTQSNWILLQVAVGLITAKASHIVWPPSRWQRIKSVVFPGRVLIREPGAVMLEDRALSPMEFEETLLNDISGNNCDNTDISRQWQMYRSFYWEILSVGNCKMLFVSALNVYFTEVIALLEHFFGWELNVSIYLRRWRFGVVVTHWSQSTRLTYAEPC